MLALWAMTSSLITQHFIKSLPRRLQAVIEDKAIDTRYTFLIKDLP
jgi:hypothetical protein